MRRRILALAVGIAVGFGAGAVGSAAATDGRQLPRSCANALDAGARGFAQAEQAYTWLRYAQLDRAQAILDGGMVRIRARFDELAARCEG